MPSGCTKGRVEQKLNIKFQYADFNALLLKHFFVAKEVRFMRVKKLVLIALNYARQVK